MVSPGRREEKDCDFKLSWFGEHLGKTFASYGQWILDGEQKRIEQVGSSRLESRKNDCKDRTTIAQKTHRLHNNQACEFEQGIILVRNPFDAILAAYNHHKAGKTGEPPMTVYKGPDWPEFVDHWAYRWEEFHLQWLAFDGPVEWTCFQTLIKDPVETAGKWLDFLEMDHRRLGCIHADPTGQFQRKKTQDYSHLYTPKMAKYVHQKIKTISDGFKQKGIEDCTQYFKYDKCC
ncbi:Oidioi.mRNA.OKI2018_I69.chr2.g6120.t1.cds [Oikopleura dioica]|uniref:Oidioi.mRNA.OKI2018_I69.chr2.g6120.t1.cds n=1 Tax=Oikopleura dioica TaxID=34765 RepID=A0ABN7T6U9_OIKDI|nr:Oidioi.mRNA.OKI2018_I69.chr2.g6120.t1.cds [Oikopleura dioica]